MDEDKKWVILGILSIVLGIVSGLFFGGYCLFIGGLEQAINGFSTTPIDASQISWGIGRVLLSVFALGMCTLLGWLGGIFCFNSR